MQRHLLTAGDVAEHLRTKVDTVLSMIRSGELRAFDVSRPGSRKPRWRIDPDALESLLTARSAKKTPRRTRRGKQQIQNVTEYF